jgi:RimJ/RimL family protein N-acetyltransferase
MQYFWTLRAEWTADRWRLPFGAFTHDGEPIGVQQVEATTFVALRTLRSGTWVGLARQQAGFGTEMREAVLELCFRHLGARFADAGTNETNVGAQRMLQRLGYRWNGVGLTANGDAAVATPVVNYRLDADTWLATPRPHIAIDGLAHALDLFGVAR